MRVTLLPMDASGNTQPFPYNSGEGAGTASGFEFEVVYAATDRLTLNFGLGLIDTKYIQSGVFDGVDGQLPGRTVRVRRGRERHDRRAVRDSDWQRRALPARRQLRLHGRLRARRRVSAHADRSGHGSRCWSRPTRS